MLGATRYHVHCTVSLIPRIDYTQGRRHEFEGGESLISALEGEGGGVSM